MLTLVCMTVLSLQYLLQLLMTLQKRRALLKLPHITQRTETSACRHASSHGSAQIACIISPSPCDSLLLELHLLVSPGIDEVAKAVQAMGWHHDS